MAWFIAILAISLMVYLGLASVGHEFWIHRYYINALVFIFEYGRKRVEKVRKTKQKIQRKLSRIHETYSEYHGDDLGDETSETSEEDQDDNIDDDSGTENTHYRSDEILLQSYLILCFFHSN